MIAWSLAALAAARTIGDVVVALPPGSVGGDIGPAGAIEDLDREGVALIPGGRSRSESVAGALERVESELVVVHDAARPLASAELFDEVVAALDADEKADGVVAATPVTDTTKEVLRGHEVHRTLDRSSLWSVQTPQAFRTEALRRALDSTELLAQATDDAMLVERGGGRILVHTAPPENLKVTTPLDLRIAEMLLQG